MYVVLELCFKNDDALCEKLTLGEGLAMERKFPGKYINLKQWLIYDNLYA